MSYSDEFKINVNKLNSDESILALLEITHPFLTVPLRLVNDNRDFLFNGNNYLAMPFTTRKQNDVQGELPKVTLTVSNVGRSLVKWIDSSGGGRGATLSVILARRSAPTVQEERIFFEIETVSINTETINLNLIIQNNFTKRAVKRIYDIVNAPGLF